MINPCCLQPYPLCVWAAVISFKLPPLSANVGYSLKLDGFKPTICQKYTLEIRLFHQKS